MVGGLFLKGVSRVNEKQEKTFELYYQMGPKRSLEKLVKKSGLSLRTLASWSKKFDWQKLINEREKSDSELLREEHLELQRKGIEAANVLICKFIEDVMAGKQVLEPADFIKLYDKLGINTGGIADGVGTQPAGVNNEVTETTVTKVIKFAPFHKE